MFVFVYVCTIKRENIQMDEEDGNCLCQSLQVNMMEEYTFH